MSAVDMASSTEHVSGRYGQQYSTCQQYILSTVQYMSAVDMVSSTVHVNGRFGQQYSTCQR